ncbi:MAG: MBL fold metallo-hydrolase [Deltaproteobacteria bacterium]|nr:MBL fold metallo-hydrolase [Candidatus Zymogenaceae bacterium]
MKEVAPGIFRVTEKGIAGAMTPPVNLYVLAGDDGVIFDAGYGNRHSVNSLVGEVRKIEALCRSRGSPCTITRILPSHAHPDHVSGLKRIRRSLGLSIVLTRKMAAYLSSRESYRKVLWGDRSDHRYFSNSNLEWYATRTLNRMYRILFQFLFHTDAISDPDIIINDRSLMEINGEQWEIFPSPGHSDDHISLYNSERGILLAGDNVLRRITTWLGPPHSNLEEYIESVQYMRDLPNLTLILSAHGGLITNPRERLREILRWRERRTREVCEIVKRSGANGVTVRTIVGRLYGNESRSKQRMASGWVKVTLKHLEDTNKVVRKVHGKRGNSIVFVSEQHSM